MLAFYNRGGVSRNFLECSRRFLWKVLWKGEEPIIMDFGELEYSRNGIANHHLKHLQHLFNLVNNLKRPIEVFKQ
jgi:hypothetical protein